MNTNFEKELTQLLNKYSKENGSNTPDYLLAQYLEGCIINYNLVTQLRDDWYGRVIQYPLTPEEAFKQKNS